jgi:hypothetical protein
MTTPSHAYLALAPRPTGSRTLRDVALALFNQYSNESLSRNRALKQKPRSVKWWKDDVDASGAPTKIWHTSRPFDLRALETHLESGAFNAGSFGLFDPMCNWLDPAVHMGPEFHYVDPNGVAVTMQAPMNLGATFPLVPRLDREGMFLTSFQARMQRRIVRLWNKIVETSGNHFADEWFDDLRSLVAECISLIDTTLHQLYFKAQYSPLQGWTFDPDRLGERHGRRLMDKLSWVYQITRKQLHLTEAERNSLLRIKDLRNHLNHFDPPCFCYSLEDVVGWMNDVRQIAQISWKIRAALGSPLSSPLIGMLLLREVVFVPKTPDRRLPQPSNVGYGSASWP